MQAVEIERVRRSRSGDQEAFRGIVDAYSRPLYRAAYRVLGDAGAAEDAVQEAFLRAWRGLSRFDEKAELSTWLYRIAINAAIDVRRERQRHGAMDAQLPEDLDGQVAATSEEPDAHRHAASRAAVDLARKAIDQLPDAERTAILLRHFEGCSIAEIARALGGGENAAKQAVFRAVRKLRAVLGPHMEMSRGEPA
jgi:RNA polymerase sigma-70 factor (ECF subfamily)